MLQEATNKSILSICDISPTRCGSFEEFLLSLSGKLYEEKLTHIIVFREKPTKVIEDALSEKGAEIKVFRPSKFSIFNFFPLYYIIKKTKPEIVHFHFYPIYTVINYVGLILKVRIIYTDHMGHKKANTFFKKMARRIYYFANSKLFDCGIETIVCVSKYVKCKYYKEYGIDSKKLCIIYNGVNTKRFRKIYNTEKIKRKYNLTDELIVTCVGLREEKGVQCLINAAPAIVKNISKTKFILVGEGEFRSNLEELINELNMKNYFIFTGNTNYIEEIYNISSCVVIPTLADEAFCFVAAEAMSTETPIVAFDSGALEEIIDNKSRLIPSSSKALADKVIECLRDGNVPTKSLREHVIKNFSLERNVYNHIKMYKELLR